MRTQYIKKKTSSVALAEGGREGQAVPIPPVNLWALWASLRNTGLEVPQGSFCFRMLSFNAPLSKPVSTEQGTRTS